MAEANTIVGIMEVELTRKFFNGNVSWPLVRQVGERKSTNSMSNWFCFMHIFPNIRRRGLKNDNGQSGVVMLAIPPGMDGLFSKIYFISCVVDFTVRKVTMRDVIAPYKSLLTLFTHIPVLECLSCTQPSILK